MAAQTTQSAEQRAASKTAAQVAALSRPSRSPWARQSREESQAKRATRDVHPLDVFEPALLSRGERDAFLKHLGEPASVALHDTRGDAGVNPVEIRKWFDRFNTLEELRSHRGIAWAGIEAIRDSITRYNNWEDTCLQIQADGGPRHPSQFGWDSSGRIFEGGIGADAREMVRSEILDDGTRKPFTVHLRRATLPDNALAKMPWLGSKANKKAIERVDAGSTMDDILVDEKRGTLTCSVCDWSCTFDPKKGRSNQTMAMGRVARHLTTARDEISRHRALHQRKFR